MVANPLKFIGKFMYHSCTIELQCVRQCADTFSRIVTTTRLFLYQTGLPNGGPCSRSGTNCLCTV